MKIKKLELFWNGVMWDDYYHVFWWNWLPKKYRYFGYREDFYDHPLYSFGLWFTNVSWFLPL
jgi:hypothetical protein